MEGQKKVVSVNYMSGFDKFIWANVFLTVVVMFLEMVLHVFSMASSGSSYKSVDGLQFAKDGQTLIAVSDQLENVKIPVCVTRIGERAFSNCRGIKSVTIPDNVVSIGRAALSGCSKLNCVSIPTSVTHIGYLAFDRTDLEMVYVSAGDVERVKKLFLDSGHDIKDIKFLELKADGS